MHICTRCRVYSPYLCFSISFLARVSKSISGRAKKYKYLPTLPYLTLPYAVLYVGMYLMYVRTKRGKGGMRGLWCGVVWWALPTLTYLP